MYARTAPEIKNLIVNFAKQDDRIRAVLLNGSRANPAIKPDRLQDFDIIFIVENLESFTKDHTWTNVFGEQIISQLPDEMTFGEEQTMHKNITFAYLMLFKDKHRIDLTLFPKQKIKSAFKRDSLTNLWLDKDDLFTNLPKSDDKDYHVKRPTEKEFLDTCNEFWWVSTYVAKGILRREVFYAKEMFDTVVRPMFMKVIAWKVGIENEFNVSVGKAGKLLKKYLTDDFYRKVLQTYSNAEIEENWQALFQMVEIFQQISNVVADRLGFYINKQEEQNTIAYLKAQYKER